MEGFSKVSLGFAELVSQLMHETFDATLSANHYQTNKYLELERALDIPHSKFAALHVSEDEILEKELEIFNVELTPQVQFTQELDLIISEILGQYDDQPLIWNADQTLSVEGSAFLKAHLLETIVIEKKDFIKESLMRTDSPRLMIESGEIKTKLELSNLFENQESSNGDPIQPITTLSSSNQNEHPSPNQPGLPIHEIYDPETNDKILVIDKSRLPLPTSESLQVPALRIISKPVTNTSNASLTSEITIRFKTV
ncbi:hypothetical protein [Marinoscillum pacificum]|uniref:hypothetical protein n=1 Tax=Marinoscillum pacificum TaxID=392723 RepID=UPI0021576AD6|nr:hypothetical protein [Marinoscillum pacificum]